MTVVIACVMALVGTMYLVEVTSSKTSYSGGMPSRTPRTIRLRPHRGSHIWRYRGIALVMAVAGWVNVVQAIIAGLVWLWGFRMQIGGALLCVAIITGITAGTMYALSFEEPLDDRDKEALQLWSQLPPDPWPLP